MKDCQARPRRMAFRQERQNQLRAGSPGEIDIDTREDWQKLNGGSASPETMSKGRRGRKVNYADGKR
jgi:hypothetical protein